MNRTVNNVNSFDSLGGSKDLPKEVKIEFGKTIKLDINIDTGIR